MRIIETITYVADDGTEFDNEAACREHELTVLGVPRWIVNNDGEFGVRVMNRNYFYYKGDGLPVESLSPWRFVEKREFNEVIRAAELKEEIDEALSTNKRSRNDFDESAIEDTIMASWRARYDWNYQTATTLEIDSSQPLL